MSYTLKKKLYWKICILYCIVTLNSVILKPCLFRVNITAISIVSLYPDSINIKCDKSSQLSFNVHIQSKPVMGTHSSYKLGCASRTVG